MKLLKEHFFIGCVFLLVSILWFSPHSVNSEEAEIVFDSTDTPPFWSKRLPADGMCGEILHAIADQAKVKIHIEYIPIGRMLGNRKHGNHLGNPIFWTEHQQFSAIVPIAFFRTSLFYYRPHHPAIEYKTIDSLKGYTLGVLMGTVDDASFFTTKGINLQKSTSEELLIKMVKAHRIDFCALATLTGQTTIRSLFPDEAHQFAHIDLPESVVPIAIMIDSQHPEGKLLGEKLRNGLISIIDSGVYAMILEKYYGKGAIPGDWFEYLNKFQYQFAE